MKQNIKVILSTLGPLNLIKCAENINRIVDVQVIKDGFQAGGINGYFILQAIFRNVIYLKLSRKELQIL